MIINLSPQRGIEPVEVFRLGDSLTINGTVFDFSPLPEGATLPSGAVNCEFITGDVTRIDGELHLTLLLPHGPNPSDAVAFPAPVTVTSDGPVDLPFDPEPEPIPDPAPEPELEPAPEPEPEPYVIPPDEDEEGLNSLEAQQ